MFTEKSIVDNQMKASAKFISYSFSVLEKGLVQGGFKKIRFTLREGVDAKLNIGMTIQEQIACLAIMRARNSKKNVIELMRFTGGA